MPSAPPQHALIGDVWLDVSVRETHAITAEVSDHPVEDGAAVSDHVRPQPRSIEIEGLITNTPIEEPQSHAESARLVHRYPYIEAATPSPRRIPPATGEILAEPALGGLEALPGAGQALAVAGLLRIRAPQRRYAAEQYHTDPQARTRYSLGARSFSVEFDRVRSAYSALTLIVEQSILITVYTALERYTDVALTALNFERSAQIGRGALRFTAQGRVLRFVDSEEVSVPPLAHAKKSVGKQAAVAANPNQLPPAPPGNPNDAMPWAPLGETLAKIFARTLGGGSP